MNTIINDPTISNAVLALENNENLVPFEKVQDKIQSLERPVKAFQRNSHSIREFSGYYRIDCSTGVEQTVTLLLEKGQGDSFLVKKQGKKRKVVCLSQSNTFHDNGAYIYDSLIEGIADLICLMTDKSVIKERAFSALKKGEKFRIIHRVNDRYSDIFQYYEVSPRNTDGKFVISEYGDHGTKSSLASFDEVKELINNFHLYSVD